MDKLNRLDKLVIGLYDDVGKEGGREMELGHIASGGVKGMALMIDLEEFVGECDCTSSFCLSLSC